MPVCKSCDGREVLFDDDVCDLCFAKWPRFDGVPVNPNHPLYGTDSDVPPKWYNIRTGQRQDDVNGVPQPKYSLGKMPHPRTRTEMRDNCDALGCPGPAEDHCRLTGVAWCPNHKEMK